MVRIGDSEPEFARVRLRRNDELEGLWNFEMRDIRYKLLPAMGGGGSWEVGRLDKFLLETPLMFHELVGFGVIPPLHVLNERLRLGVYDAGMGGGCEWSPFEINEREYRELVEELLTNPEHDIIEDKELWNRTTFMKWHGALLSKHAKRVRRARRNSNK